MKEFDEYQILSERTSNHLVGTKAMTNASLGLAGEAGEVADLIKKHLFHGHKLDPDKVINELGDCLFYTAWMARILNVPLSAVAQGNVDKLRIRYPNGFNGTDSINRRI